MALYEITMFGAYFGQQTVNRWNYFHAGEVSGALGSMALLTAFGGVPTAGVYPATGIFRSIMEQLSSAFTVTSLVCRRPVDYAPSDFTENPFPTPYAGAASAEGMSPTVAYGFKTNRVRLDIARGTKRFPGVVESATSAGGVIIAPVMTLLTDIAAKMSATLVYSSGGVEATFSPCVVKKEDYVTPAGKRAYKYMDSEAAQEAQIANNVAWQVYPQVRTQTSRQYGRGV